MNSEKSKKLVRELKTSKWLPPYNSDLIKEISKETTSLCSNLAESLLNNESSLAVMQSNIINRNKRGVLAYLNYRISKLEALRIENGPSIPPHYSNQLCAEEMEYFKKYSGLLLDYNRKVSKHIDLTTDLVPPKDLYVEVRVKEDIGDILLSNGGQITLKKNTSQLVKREEVANLIRQGVLQQTN